MHRPLGRREPGRAARPPHARLDPHRDGRRHRRARPRPVHDRNIAVQRARAGRQPLGRDRFGRARLVVGARVVRAVAAWQIPDLARLSRNSRRRSSSGDIQRTTASGSWFAAAADGFTAVTAPPGATKPITAPSTRCWPRRPTARALTRVWARRDAAGGDAGAANADGVPRPFVPTPKDVVTAATAGLRRRSAVVARLRDRRRRRRHRLLVPGRCGRLRRPPVSFHVFVRVRPPAGHMGRMWNMRMARPYTSQRRRTRSPRGRRRSARARSPQRRPTL